MGKFTSLLKFIQAKPNIREATMPPSVHHALATLKRRMLDYETLRTAVRAVLADDEGAMRAFCEDYGLDQIDPVTKMDVLRFAIRLTELPHG